MDVQTSLALGGLRKALEEIADGISPDLTLRQLLMLLHVASSTSPLSQRQLTDRTGEAKGLVSKWVALLAAPTGDVRRDGLGVLNVDLDPDDMRSRIVTLTKEGEKVLTRAIRQVTKG